MHDLPERSDLLALAAAGRQRRNLYGRIRLVGAFGISRMKNLTKMLDLFADNRDMTVSSVPSTPRFVSRLRTQRDSGLLTRTEITVLALLSQGLSSKQIADQMQLTKRVVNCHLSHIYEVLGTMDRMEALRLAEQRGLLS